MTSPAEAASFSAERRRMVAEQLRARGIADERILQAMDRVPRHEFIPVSYRDQAYEDHPLPIGQGQTISQPYIVALMLEALALKPEDKVLEVGTGSGYVTALLAELAAEVFSIERHAPLAEEARATLTGLGYMSAKIFVGDGSQGLPDYAPYNAILVSAAASKLPPSLVGQLAEGGRMIIPVGTEDAQQLQLITMDHGQPQVRWRELCRFVPLVQDRP